ncbi:MAG: hypothetical protein CMJ65_03200 [Planctomycetaceae bacterium]|nr:hypothetical protein [Planctomycetaceae bacterium]
MNSRPTLKTLVALLATTSLLGSQVLLPAAGIALERTKSLSSDNAGPVAVVADVALAEGNTLSGQVVDSRNRPRAGTVVTLRRGHRVIGQARADARGHYAFVNVAGGLYQLQVDETVTVIRAWSIGTAPRTASLLARVVVEPSVFRGQNGAGAAGSATSGGIFGGALGSTTLVTAVVVGAVVGAVFIIDELDDDDDPPASP